jgi:SAM-dependent methyltransferase
VSDDARARLRAAWEAGDLDALTEMVLDAGPRLLDRLEPSPGLSLLDVATGSGGSVAVPAAARGMRVTACDLTDAWFATGRRRAREAGVAVDWLVADAAALPFPDRAFDRVTSTFGHMFAPDHAATGSELARVCAPGGMVGIVTWDAGSFPLTLLAAIARHLPAPPAGALSPALWGAEDHVRAMLAPHGVELVLERDVLVFEQPSLAAAVAFYEANLGPAVAARRGLGEERWPAVRSAMEAAIAAHDSGDGDRVRLELACLVAVGRRR